MVFTKRFSSGCLVAIYLTGLLIGASGCSQERAEEHAKTDPLEVLETDEQTKQKKDSPEMNDQSLATATFGSGCYWCTEAIFQRIDGVENVVSGFMGGHVENPTYEQVCNMDTGHAEVIHFNYDPSKVRFEELLEVFWKTHDPTTPNQQGADVGPQYRSAVFYHSDEQKALAESYKAKLDESGAFENRIVTEISPASQFFPAKSQHQNFYNANPNQGYCNFVIRPKLEKLQAVFGDKLKQAE